MSTLKRVVRVVAATLLTVGIFAGTTAASESAVAKPKPGGVAIPMDTGWPN
ncbi:MAG: hypothetical protein J7518_14340 [Nocardioidaceae bacterium]|nr:hypothetical protein [Nocardioidaceae bacterium]